MNFVGRMPAEIPRAVGENAGFRDDASRKPRAVEMKLDPYGQTPADSSRMV